ncbi:MAG: hypothetical protein II453_16790, partial [Alphaproteobacteria bacterium]|nr:hypothetical protein [Alphaproteobacteria bacterium]
MQIENIYGNLTLCTKIHKKDKNNEMNFSSTKDNIPSPSLITSNNKMDNYLTKNLTYSFKYKSTTYEYKEETKHLSVSYYNRCNEPISLGFIDVMKAVKKENNLSTSFLENLKLFLMSKYKKDKKMLITFLYDPEIKSQKIFVEDNIAKLANYYPSYVFTIINWKDGDFIAKHFDLKDNGYIHIAIVDFSNENEFGGEIRSLQDIEIILDK